LTAPTFAPVEKKTATAAKLVVKKAGPAKRSKKTRPAVTPAMDSRTEEREFMVKIRAHVIHHGGQTPSWREIFRLLISWGYSRPDAAKPQGGPAEDEFEAVMKRHGTEDPATLQHGFRVFKMLGYRLGSVTSRAKR
jgi:hypothetical protein